MQCTYLDTIASDTAFEAHDGNLTIPLQLLRQPPSSRHSSAPQYKQSAQQLANPCEDRQPYIAPILPIQNRARNRLTNERRKTDDKVMRAQPRSYRAHILR